MTSDGRSNGTLRGRDMPKPPGARTTKSIARRLPPEIGMNQDYLKFANVHILLSEVLEKPSSWKGNAVKTAEAVDGALEKLKVRSEKSKEAFAEYQFIKGFRGFSSDGNRLASFEHWLKTKETDYMVIATVYADLGYSGRRKLGIGTTQNEVLAACDALIRPVMGEGVSTAIVAFPELIGSKVPINGTDSTWGQLEKEKFDCWLQANPEKMFPKRESGELVEALSKAEYQNSALEQGNAELEKRLSEATKELRTARLGAMRAEGEKSGLSERLKARGKELETAQEKISGLETENADLRDINEKRLKLMAEAAEEAEKTLAELTELRAQNEVLSRRVTEMEDKFTTLTAKIDGRDSGELTEEDTERPTMASEVMVVPDAVGAVPEEIKEFESISAEKLLEGDAAGLLEAAAEQVTVDEEESPTDMPSPLFEQVLMESGKVEPTKEGEEKIVSSSESMADLIAASMGKKKEVTQKLELGEIEEVPAAAEKGRFWKTKIGRAVDNIFVYGVGGKGDKRLPPKPENYTNDVEYVTDDRAYNSWHGNIGRKIRKTLEGTRKNWKTVTAVATGVTVLAAATTGYFMYAPAQERPEQRALSELNKPAVTQVAVVDETATEEALEAKKVEPKPEPLAKPVLADVLAKHNLELEKGTNMAKFYTGLTVEDVQERYVILEEALRSDEQLQKYERKYSEKPILEMYADFLKTAMAYAELRDQTDAEKAGAKAAGERVAKRLQKLTQQKRIKKKVGKVRASEMKDFAGQFTEFASALPTIEDKQPEEEKIVELPVVTPEELKEMKKSGEEPETAVIILPDKINEKPFDVEKATGEVLGAEFEMLDSPSKVNEFNRKVNKAKDMETKFLLSAHLSDQLIEQDMGAKMSEKRVLLMHIDTMNAAILFARAEGQGMTAIAEALNVFDAANAKVKKYMRYKKLKKELKGRAGLEKNLTWLRNRAEELKGKLDAYERNKDTAVPLPGSPAVENGNGAPTTMPEKVQLSKENQFAAMQTVVFSNHGLSILEHPLKVYKQMKSMKINNFDKFIILENLVEKVRGDARWIDGLTKAEQFDLLRILSDYIKAAKKAADEPKNWPEGYSRDDIMLNSLAIDVSEMLKEIRKLGKARLPENQEHLLFPLDQNTFRELGEAVKEFDEQLNYEYKQKQRKTGTAGE